MSIDVNAIEQTVEVTAVGDEVNVNIIDQPVLVSVTDQIIEVEASGAAGPQGPAGAGVAAGGTTGQVLSKASNTNYDTVWVDAGAGTVYSVNASGSTGISVTGGPITGAGTLTITNTAPDQIVALTGAGTAVITGTYPNFTITANDQYSGTVTSVNLTAGTGISVSGGPITSSGSISVTNTAPDQVVSLTGGGTTTITGTYPNFTISSADSAVGTVTSVNMTVPTGLTISGNPITSAGTLALALASGYSIPTTASQATWDAAYNDKINSAAVTGTTTKTLTLNQQDGGTVTASWSDIDTGLTSVGLSMPSAFAVSNSPLTSNGTLAVTGAGTSAQYVRGDGQLANFPTNVGGGSSVNYYLNGSVSQGTFGGDTYYEMSKTPIIGAGTNFTRTNAQGNGYIASFITDAGDPALLNIPGGNWNLEFYFQASSGGGNPSFYAELYKVSSANVFTLIGSGSTNPEGITNGTAVDQYYTSIPVPQTALLATDRIAIRIFVTPSGRTITLHTENSNLCEVLTTFSTGLNALNGLTDQVQYFATGTSGTDFAISSATDTHTFNLPIASGTNTGKLSNTDWTTFNSKQNAITLTTTGTSGASTFISNTLNVPTYTLSGLGGVPTSRTLTINGTAFDLSADRTFSVGTVTSVAALTLGTTGTDLSSTVANGTTTPVITLQVPTASATNRGALSSADWTTFNGKQAALNGTGFVKISGTTISYDNSTYYLASNPSAYIALTALTASAPLSYNNTTGAFTISQASGSVNGFLSSTDWTTFNNKQNTITNPVTGTGTTNYLPKWTSGSAIGNSLVHDDGTNVGIGTASAAYKLDVAGEVRANNLFRTTDGTNIGIFGSSVFNTNVIGIGSSNNVPLVFGTNATERARFTSGGNLLVNSTTDNGSRLQVTGNGYFDGNVGVGTAGPYFAKLQINASGAGFQDALILENTNSAAANLGTALTFAGVGSVAQTVIRSAWDGAATTDAYMSFLTKGSGSVTERMRITSSGNLGLGVQPSAWSVGKAIQVDSVAVSLWGVGNQTALMNNAYYNSGDKYAVNGEASYYLQASGSHKWFNAPSGTAGNAISFTQAMTLTANGRLLLGTTTEGTYLLDVNGTGSFSDNVLINKTGASTLNLGQGTTTLDYGRINFYGKVTGNSQTIGYMSFINTQSGSAVNSGELEFAHEGTTADNKSYFSLKVHNGTSLINPLLIASTGAASFSSSVAAASYTVNDAGNITVGTTTGTKIGTATSQKLSFWNATPIVQPTTAVAAATFVANTSLIMNDTATFDGYTIGQVVKALRNAGLLA
jgi:hypothetical protein